MITCSSTTPSPTSIRISALGPIPQAEVELGLLTVLTGENNRGKSWLASLIWGRTQVPDRLWSSVDPRTRTKLIEIAQRMWAKQPASTEPLNVTIPSVQGRPLPPGAMDPTDALWQEWVHHCDAAAVDLHEKLLSHVFRADVAATVRSTLQPAPFVLRHDEAGAVAAYSPRWSGVNERRPLTYADPELVEPLVQRLCFTTVGLNSGLSEAPARFDSPSRSLYFAASRTGFVQALPILAENLIGEALGDSGGPTLPSLPAPTVQLLRLLVNPGQAGAENNDLIAILEGRLLRGRVHRAAAGIQYEYQPAETTLRVPMGRSSAVVTELLPLALVLQRVTLPSFLVYEEPEAHLHPELQRQLARVLVRMARRGTRLLITTHSDVFVQEINNCVKVGALRARGDAEASLGPGEEEAWLTPEEVRAYEFGGDAEGQTEVRRLKVLEEGVVAPMFNASIDAQTAEVIRLNARLDEARG